MAAIFKKRAQIHISLNNYRTGYNPFDVAACIKMGTGKLNNGWETSWGSQKSPVNAVTFGEVVITTKEGFDPQAVQDDITEALNNLKPQRL